MNEEKQICANCLYYEYGKEPQPYCNYPEDNGKQYVKPSDSCECFEPKFDIMSIEHKNDEQKDFLEMANVVEKYMQKHCHPHNTIIATLSGIEVVEGIEAKPFKVLD